MDLHDRSPWRSKPAEKLRLLDVIYLRDIFGVDGWSLTEKAGISCRPVRPPSHQKRLQLLELWPQPSSALSESVRIAPAPSFGTPGAFTAPNADGGNAANGRGSGAAGNRGSRADGQGGRTKAKRNPPARHCPAVEFASPSPCSAASRPRSARAGCPVHRVGGTVGAEFARNHPDGLLVHQSLCRL
jgi:hypothetical protein